MSTPAAGVSSPRKFQIPGLDALKQLPKPLLLGAAALLAALLIVAVLWSRGPEYRVLFSNLDDQDGGAIVTALTQMNVPYRFSDGGGALLVPADKVYDTRLQLASRGLPKGGTVGFELLDNARFGESQFTEQVNYQRALEGELSRSIEALQVVKSARVHLALPRQSLFVREREKPTASVLLNLYPGRDLGDSQANAIAWLIASSIPNLAADSVSIVDQNGRLLSKAGGGQGLGGDQLRQTHDIEQRVVERILALLTPVVGAGNVQTQVSADMDFSQREETSEVYRPNQAPNQAAVRSEQTSSSSQTGIQGAIGVPGALSNQAPANPTAPLIQPPANTGNGANNAQGANGNPPAAANASGRASPVTPSQQRQDSTINYEVDRTISHVRAPTTTLRRLSVAVVLNYRPDAGGKLQPLPAADLSKIDSIVRQAMGFDAQRGDTLSVVSSPCNEPVEEKVPYWRDPMYIDLAKTIGMYIAIALVALLGWRIWVRSRRARESEQHRAQLAEMASKGPSAESPTTPATQDDPLARKRAQTKRNYEDNLKTAQDLAEKDPRAVAMIVRSWMSDADNQT